MLFYLVSHVDHLPSWHRRRLVIIFIPEYTHAVASHLPFVVHQPAIVDPVHPPHLLNRIDVVHLYGVELTMAYITDYIRHDLTCMAMTDDGDGCSLSCIGALDRPWI